MHTKYFVRSAVVMGLLALIAWLPAVAATLKACRSRTPEDASAGQRLMAEASGERDKADRTPVNAVPEV